MKDLIENLHMGSYKQQVHSQCRIITISQTLRFTTQLHIVERRIRRLAGGVFVLYLLQEQLHLLFLNCNIAISHVLLVHQVSD